MHANNGVMRSFKWCVTGENIHSVYCEVKLNEASRASSVSRVISTKAAFAVYPQFWVLGEVEVMFPSRGDGAFALVDCSGSCIIPAAVLLALKFSRAVTAFLRSTSSVR